jgi:hypothetical protein
MPNINHEEHEVHEEYKDKPIAAEATEWNRE